MRNRIELSPQAEFYAKAAAGCALGAVALFGAKEIFTDNEDAANSAEIACTTEMPAGGTLSQMLHEPGADYTKTQHAVTRTQVESGINYGNNVAEGQLITVPEAYWATVEQNGFPLDCEVKINESDVSRP